MATVELHIAPEPSPDERAAIVAALEQAGPRVADDRSAWGRPELEEELETPPTGA
jgi:hypothetical protein